MALRSWAEATVLEELNFRWLNAGDKF